MEKYKPGYLGKVLPVDNQNKMTDFVANKYDAFSKVYDTCKTSSENIKDIKSVETSDNSFSVKVSTDSETMQCIKENNKDESVNISGDTITVNT